MIEREKLTRSDYQRIVRFTTADELLPALLAYDAVDPSIPQQVMDEIIPRITETGKWDYASRRPDCKLQARRGEDGLYYLKVFTDAVGPGVSEKFLAEKTGASIGYVACEIIRTWPSDGSRFCIPLSDIEAIYDAVGVTFDRLNFSKALLRPSYQESAPDFPHHFISPVTVVQDDQIIMRFALKPLIDPARDRRPLPEGQTADYLYHIEDGYVTGPKLWTGNSPYGNNGMRAEFVPIQGCVAIRPIHGLPIWADQEAPTFDATVQARIRAMGDRIEATLSTPATVASNAHTRNFMAAFSKIFKA